MSRVDHVALKVDNLEEAEKWYTTHVGGEVTYRDEKYIRLRLDNIVIALIDRKFYPWEHVSIWVENADELPHHMGKTIEHRDGSIGVYAKDPFGNYLEYIWYNEELREMFYRD